MTSSSASPTLRSSHDNWRGSGDFSEKVTEEDFLRSSTEERLDSSVLLEDEKNNKLPLSQIKKSSSHWQKDALHKVQQAAFPTFKLLCLCVPLLIGNQVVKRVQAIPYLEIMEGPITILTSAATLNIGRLIAKDTKETLAVKCLSAFGAPSILWHSMPTTFISTLIKIASIGLTSSILQHFTFKKLTSNHHLVILGLGISACFAGAVTAMCYQPGGKHNEFKAVTLIFGIMGYLFTAVFICSINQIMKDKLKLSMPN